MESFYAEMISNFVGGSMFSTMMMGRLETLEN